MDPFDKKFWNLAQAAAWVVYREKELVTRFEQPTREGPRTIAGSPSCRRSHLGDQGRRTGSVLSQPTR